MLRIRLLLFKLIISIGIFFATFFLIDWLYNYFYSSESIKIRFSVKYENDDKLMVFYHLKKDSLSKSYPFNASQSVSENIHQTEGFQLVDLVIPTSEIVDQIRIDHTVGGNNVEFKYIEISRKGNKKIILPEEFNDYFSFSKFCAPVVEHGKLTIFNKRVGGKLDPHFIYSNLNYIYLPKSTLWEWIQWLISLLLALTLFLYIVINIDYKPRKNVHEMANISFFILVIFLPGMIFFPKNEQSYSGNFEDYFDQNFGLRDLYLDLNTFISLKVFHTSPNPNRAIIGKDAWFFYSRNDIPNSYYAALDDYLHLNLLSESELKNTKQKICKRKSFANDHGAAYIKFVYPNKASIYPEYLPNRLKVSSKMSRLDQVADYLSKTNSQCNITVIANELVNKKGDNQLYFKFDTHWNMYGAFTAYQIMETYISQKVKGYVKLDLSQYHTTWEIKEFGDLLKTTNINSGFEDNIPIVTKTPKSGYYVKGNKPMVHGKNYRTYNNLAKNKIKVVVFRDSFTNNLLPFISDSFYEVYYVWNSFSNDVILQEKPDLVIDGFVERAGIR